MKKNKPTIREALEGVIFLFFFSIFCYFILVLQVWVAENKLEINIFKTKSGRLFIFVLVVFVLFYSGRYLFRYWKKKRD